MKRIFLIIATALLFCTSCEKKCMSKITTDEIAVSIKIDGNQKTIYSGETIKVEQGTVISFYGSNQRIYSIEECGQLYVIVKDGTKYILTKY